LNSHPAPERQLSEINCRFYYIRRFGQERIGSIEMLVDQSFGKRRLNRKEPITVKAVTRYRRFPIQERPIGIMLLDQESGKSLDIEMSVTETIQLANELLCHCGKAANEGVA
jgi:hypothetical protein